MTSQGRRTVLGRQGAFSGNARDLDPEVSRSKALALDRRTLLTVAVILAAWFSAGSSLAQGAPILQLYIEGATYRPEDRTWLLEVAPGNSFEFRLWAIGATESFGPITAVRLSAAYPSWLRSAASDLAFTLTPTTTGGLGGFTDPSVPPWPTLSAIGGPGTRPLVWDTTYLPPHGVFSSDTVWQEFSLGDFTLTDSPVANFDQTFPPPTAEKGQINVYKVTVIYPTPLPEGTWVHFDLYGVNDGRAVFLPFSHDAEVVVAPTFVISAPPTLLLAAIMAGLMALSRAIPVILKRRGFRRG